MSTPYTTGPVDTLPKWNAVLAAACCCEMPECPIPDKTCESRTATVSEYEGSEEQAFDEAYAAWEIAWDAWDAGGQIGPEPEQPEIPDGVTFGAWAPWGRPAGADEDPLPSIYRKNTQEDPSAEGILYTGTVGSKFAMNDWNGAAFPTVWIQASVTDHATYTYAGELGGAEAPTTSGFDATYDSAGTNLTCTANGGGTFPNFALSIGNPFLPEDATLYSVNPESGGTYNWSEVDPHSYAMDGPTITFDSGKWRLLFGAAQSADSCPGPWGQAYEGAALRWDWSDLYARGASQTVTMGDGITRAGLAANANAKLADLDFASGTCVATLAATWPTIDDFDWTITAETLWGIPINQTTHPRRTAAGIVTTGIRFRWSVPDAHEGTWYRVMWDIIEEPTGWDRTIPDPENPGGAEIPDPTAPARSWVSQDTVWTWTGSPFNPLADPPDATRISGWYQIDPPTVPGTRRVVNGRVWHLNPETAPYGSLPTLFGDQVTLPVADAIIEAGGINIADGWLMGAARPGDAPVVAIITVRNTGEFDLSVSALTSSDPAFTVGTLPGPIAPAATAEIEITFTPAASETFHTAVLTLAGNLPGGSIAFDVHAVTYVSAAPVCGPGDMGLVGLSERIVSDSLGKWLEVGFQMDTLLTGSAATGWTGPGGVIRFDLRRSTNLTDWTDGWTDATGSPTEVSSGVWEYWSRPIIPAVWWSTLSDRRVVSDRYGKEITAIHLGQTSPVLISLPNYPYAMPADAAQLQTDLRANGHPDAEVTVTAGTFRVTAINYTASRRAFTVTLSGTNVIAVADGGVPISLPGFPYAMPSQRAQLQTDLRAAGKTYAVVEIFEDEWEITLPDLTDIRGGRVTYTPGDPFATWSFTGGYLGDAPGNTLQATETNLRDPLGVPLTEAKAQFARLAVQRVL